ncbi:unnamed protein product [Pleuronectes platessa]|uniref:Uncharacterized protein n=1 Tax=Pleuronectes platessa TaxID=8262 RepID=A0A9N7YWJ2_PLEPL|nr:unnamed protein product [Pleuronectes platessa]
MTELERIGQEEWNKMLTPMKRPRGARCLLRQIMDELPHPSFPQLPLSASLHPESTLLFLHSSSSPPITTVPSASSPQPLLSSTPPFLRTGLKACLGLEDGVWASAFDSAAKSKDVAQRASPEQPYFHATVSTARPNKGQGCAFLLRSSFASRRQTASQSLFKRPANSIRWFICEALSPWTPASAGTTSQGIMGLLVVIGGDRESEGSRHHKASTRLGVSQE